MKRLVALAILISFVPYTILARAIPASSLNVLPSLVQDGPTALPSPTPDVELEDAKRQAALAEERKKKEVAEKEAAEARRDQLKAQTEPLGDTTKVTVPTGSVTTDQGGFVEVEMLSQEAARDITRRLAKNLCGSAKDPGTLVIYSGSDMAALALYSSMVKQLRKFKSDFDQKKNELVTLKNETDPKTRSNPSETDFAGLAAIAIPGVATGIIKSVAELINLFRTDTEFKNKAVSIPEDMAVSYLVRSLHDEAMCTPKPAVFYPALYPPELFLDEKNSELLTVLTELGPLRANAISNIQEVDKRIKLINDIASMIEQRDAKAEETAKKEEARKTLLANDPKCRKPKCVKLTEEIAELQKGIKELNGKISEQTGNSEAGFLSQHKNWLSDLKKFKAFTQLLIDSADQITSKLNTPDEATKLTAMAQLLRAEQLASILKKEGSFTLRVAVTANGTTKIKKNLFVDAKVRHSAGAKLVYQLFDRDGRVVLGDSMQYYFDYQSARDVRALVRTEENASSDQENDKTASDKKKKKDAAGKTGSLVTSRNSVRP